jgi:hypothetical protein
MRVTEGGRVYGILVSVHRVRLGLSRAELAARLQTSTSKVARIERGHPPSAEMVDKLAAELYPESRRGPVGRLIAWVARVDWKPTLRVPGGSRSVRTGLVALRNSVAALGSGLAARVRRAHWKPTPRMPRSSRSVWAGLAVVNILIALALGGRFSSSGLGLSGGSSSVDRGPSVSQDSLAEFIPAAIPAAVHREGTGTRAAAPARKEAALNDSVTPESGPLSAPSTPTTSVAGPTGSGSSPDGSPPGAHPGVSAPPPSGGGGGAGGGNAGGAPVAATGGGGSGTATGGGGSGTATGGGGSGTATGGGGSGGGGSTSPDPAQGNDLGSLVQNLLGGGG